MGTDFTYLEVEDRLYRSPTDAPLNMELWSDQTHEWTHYLGDTAHVLLEGTITTAPDEAPTETQAFTNAYRRRLLSLAYEPHPLTPDERSAASIKAWDTRGRQHLEMVAPGLGTGHSGEEQAALLLLHETVAHPSARSHETLSAVDPATGRVVVTPVRGNADSVKIPDEAIDALVKSGASDLMVAHTHPKSGPFSYDDVRAADRMNAQAGRRLVKQMVVFGSDGSWYELTVPGPEAVGSPQRRWEFFHARNGAVNQASRATDAYVEQHYGQSMHDATDATRSALLAAHPEIGAVHQRHFVREMTAAWVDLAARWQIGFRYHLAS